MKVRKLVAGYIALAFVAGYFFGPVVVYLATDDGAGMGASCRL